MAINNIGDNPQNVIKRAVATGTQKFLRLSFAAFAVENTGAIIKATTAGRIPLNTFSTIGLSFIVVKNIAIVSITIKEGRIVPNAEKNAPLFFAILLPTKTAILTANIPGID